MTQIRQRPRFLFRRCRTLSPSRQSCVDAWYGLPALTSFLPLFWDETETLRTKLARSLFFLQNHAHTMPLKTVGSTTPGTNRRSRSGSRTCVSSVPLARRPRRVIVGSETARTFSRKSPPPPFARVCHPAPQRASDRKAIARRFEVSLAVS